MTDIVVAALERNIKVMMEEIRLDGSSFTAGLAVITKASRKSAESRLLREVFDACVDYQSERPGYGRGFANDYVERHLPDNVEQPLGHLSSAFAAAVMVKAFVVTPGATPREFVAAVKNLNLMPEDRDDQIYECVELVRQIKSERYPDVLVPPVERGGLTSEENRNMILVRLSEPLKRALRFEYVRQEMQSRVPERSETAGVGQSDHASAHVFQNEEAPPSPAPGAANFDPPGHSQTHEQEPSVSVSYGLSL